MNSKTSFTLLRLRFCTQVALFRLIRFILFGSSLLLYRKHNYCLDSQALHTSNECYGDWIPHTKIYDSKDWRISFCPHPGLSYALQQRTYIYDERANAARDQTMPRWLHRVALKPATLILAKCHGTEIIPYFYLD